MHYVNRNHFCAITLFNEICDSSTSFGSEFASSRFFMARMKWMRAIRSRCFFLFFWKIDNDLEHTNIFDTQRLPPIQWKGAKNQISKKFRKRAVNTEHDHAPRNILFRAPLFNRLRTSFRDKQFRTSFNKKKYPVISDSDTEKSVICDVIKWMIILWVCVVCRSIAHWMTHFIHSC